MLNNEIEELLTEAGVPCISIIVPTHRVSPDRKMDAEIISKAVKYTKESMMQIYTGDDLPELIAGIDALVEQIDYTHLKDGVGIYVSPRIARLVQFPFPVTEKIKTDVVFDRRDLLYYTETIIDYYILSISQKHIHLFRAKGEEISEIRNSDFPMDYEETYEYAKPSRGTSFGNSAFKDFERDKSVMKEIRLTDLLRKADRLLVNYINDHVPLVISGGKKELVDFMEITDQKKRVIAKVSGHYNSHSTAQLAALSWQEVRSYQDKQQKNLLSNLYELIGQNRLVTGIEEVWKAAAEGKGLELVVEKDYGCHGYLSANGHDLKKEKPVGQENCTLIKDAVELVIRKVQEKKGKITFVENGTMKDFGRIALQLRYTTAHHA